MPALRLLTALLTVALVVAGSGLPSGSGSRPDTLLRPGAAHAGSADDAVARGGYLVAAMGCGDCHTPLKMGASGPERDAGQVLAGHPASLVMPDAPELGPGPWMGVMSATMTAWSGPWGVAFAANLTPDPATGLGAWTEEEFVATARSGRHRGRGREILPAMPMNLLDSLTDADLSAVFAYLQSLPPIVNAVPAPRPPRA